MDIPEHVLARERYLNEERNRAHDRLDAIIEKLDQAAVETGQQTAKIVIGINGGAVGGILAFVGGLAAKNIVGLQILAQQVAFFAAGVLAGALGLAFGFLTNYALASAVRNIARVPGYPYQEETTESFKWFTRAKWFGRATLATSATGFVFFITGCTAVYFALLGLKGL